MMDKKIIAFFLLLLSWAIYDLFGVPDWSTNWVVFFYSSFYGFVLFWLFDTWKFARDWFNKVILAVIGLGVVARLLPQFFAINKTREEYNEIVSNGITDLVTWIVVIIVLTLVLWVKFIQLSRL